MNLIWLVRWTHHLTWLAIRHKTKWLTMIRCKVAHKPRFTKRTQWSMQRSTVLSNLRRINLSVSKLSEKFSVANLNRLMTHLMYKMHSKETKTLNWLATCKVWRAQTCFKTKTGTHGRASLLKVDEILTCFASNTALRITSWLMQFHKAVAMPTNWLI